MRKRPDKAARGSVLDAASRQRLIDAHVLEENGCHLAAAYLAGYAIEFALKATICRRRGIIYLEDRDKDHIESPRRLQILLERAGLSNAVNQNPSARTHFDVLLTHWSVHMRYQAGKGDPDAARAMLDAAGWLLDCLRAQ